MTRRSRSLRKSALVLALLVSFLAGQVSAGTEFASFINKGLVNAFSSVGQNLFGEAAFESRFVPPTPTFPAGSVQMFVAEDVKLGTGLNVFVPPSAIPVDPCRAAIQIRMGNGPPPIMPFQIVVDPDVVGDVGSFLEDAVVEESLAGYRPSLARCEEPPTDCGVDACP
jgi:hypothetical protein